MAGLIHALILGKRVSEEVFQKRLKICKYFRFLSIKNSKQYCNICGCSVSENKRILNLAHYEEHLPLYGCKHPRGSRWQYLKKP